jgi:opacity protein-like surface antigen
MTVKRDRTTPFVFSLLAAAALVVASASPALAQQTGTTPGTEPATVQPTHPTPPPVGIVDQGMWTITPFISSGFAGGLDGGSVNVGVATAYNWTPRWSVEGEFGFMPGATQGPVAPFDSNIVTLSANGVYHFAVENVAPYLTLGAGLARATTDDMFVADQSSTVFAVNFGGGVKARLTEATSLRADVRYFNGRDLVPDFWRAYAGLTFNVMAR